MAARPRQGRHGAGRALPDARPLHELPQGSRVGGAPLPCLQHAHARGVHQGEPAAPVSGPPPCAGSHGGGGRAAPRCDRARSRGRHARRRRHASPGRRALPPRLRGGRPPRGDAGHPCLGLAPGRGRCGSLLEVHPGSYVLARLRPDAADYLRGLRGHSRALPAPAHRLPRGGLRLGPLLDGAHGRRVRQARRGGARAHEKAERLHPERLHLLLLRGRRVAPAPGPQAGGREPDRLRLRLPALGSQLPGLHRRDQGAGGHHGHPEAQDPRRQHAPPVRPQALEGPHRMDCCSHEGPSRGDAKFEFQKVADGVYAAVAEPAYKVNSNTAIIESDDGLMVVDTHSKPSAARVIVDQLREMTSKPVRYVVNTHFHWDHWHGNEVYPAAYPDAEIVTNDITREAMVKKGLKRIQDNVRQVPAEIAKLRADIQAASPAARGKLEADLKLAESYLAEVRALKPALPTIAFEQTMKLYRRDREIHLLHLGRAHTEGDVFVYLPKEKVVITGDAMIGWTPYMGDGYPEDWAGTLDRLTQLDFTHIIMGHGDVTGREWLNTFRSYVRDMVDGVRREVASGATLDEVKQRVPAALAGTYEKPFSKYGDYRPWRTGILANIERTYAMVS